MLLILPYLNKNGYRKIQKIDQLIKLKQTGTPTQLSQKIECSERTVYKYIKFLREEMNAPIKFNPNKISYTFTEERELGLMTFKLKKQRK